MSVRVGINGFGRIGRNVFRAAQARVAEATGEDAIELLLAGASAVEVGTATLADPRAPLRVVEGIERWCRRHGVGSVRELIGGVQ